jgi:hypothetical protein
MNDLLVFQTGPGGAASVLAPRDLCPIYIGSENLSKARLSIRTIRWRSDAPKRSRIFAVRSAGWNAVFRKPGRFAIRAPAVP